MPYVTQHSPTHYLLYASTEELHNYTHKCRESSIPSVVGNFATLASAVVREPALHGGVYKCTYDCSVVHNT